MKQVMWSEGILKLSSCGFGWRRLKVDVIKVSNNGRMVVMATRYGVLFVFWYPICVSSCWSSHVPFLSYQSMRVSRLP